MEITTGRREGDGHVRVYLFTGELLALTMEGQGERVPTLLLTLEQARKLRDALDHLIPLMEDAERKKVEKATSEAWQGEERRLTAR
jgi:hypothetical protein